jgi:hypothetical protein
MSHFAAVQTKIDDLLILAIALKDWRNWDLILPNSPYQLKGYYAGLQSGDFKAIAYVSHLQMGLKADLGFIRSENATAYQAVCDEYELGREFSRELAVRYSLACLKKLAQEQNAHFTYTVKDSGSIEGEIVASLY